jgi:C-terminal processing protease CtpA/Prc
MPRPVGKLVLAALLSLLTLGGQPEAELQTARVLLTGARKDPEKARRVLLELVRRPAAEAGADTLAYACVYLGYIEDRSGDRQRAVEWFRKALALEGAGQGILSVARRGVEQPVTWIRHLDEGAAPPAVLPTPAAETPRPARAYVTTQPPAAMALARNLSDRERRESFEALWSALDTNYACFRLKGIDWRDTGRRFRARLENVQSDEAFYDLLFQLVNELKDTHSWLQNYHPRPLPEVPGMALDVFGQRPYVIWVGRGSAADAAGVVPGWEVLSVDGLAVADKMEELRPRLRAMSSERAYRREAGRHLLASAAPAPAILELRTPEGVTRTVTLARGPASRPRAPAWPPGIELTRQRFVHFGRHPSGLGYILIESFNGRGEIADEFDRAIAALRDTSALLLDIRDNPGGYGQPRIVGRLLTKRTLVGIANLKNGPGHSDLKKHPDYLGPSGPWQYKRPIALLVNDVTGSAADLFACELRSAGRVLTVGSTTHGNLSGVATYVVLPCGLIVRVSNGYLSDSRGRPIEGAGNIPDIAVEPTIEDFLAGRDPVIDRAIAALRPHP